MEKLHKNHVTKHQNLIAEKSRMSNERELWSFDVVSKCDVTRPLPKEMDLGLAEEEWKNCFYYYN